MDLDDLLGLAGFVAEGTVDVPVARDDPGDARPARHCARASERGNPRDAAPAAARESIEPAGMFMKGRCHGTF